MRDPGGVPDRAQGAHGHLGTGLFAETGSHRLRGDGRDPLRDRQRAAGRALHGGAHPCEPGGRDAGALGHPRGPQHRVPDGLQPPGRVRHDRGGLQHRRDLPHAGGPFVRRGGGPHARKAYDSRTRRNSVGGAAAHGGQGRGGLPSLSAPGGRPAAHERLRGRAPLQRDRTGARHVGLSLGQSRDRPRAFAPHRGQDREQRGAHGALQDLSHRGRRNGAGLLRLVGQKRPAHRQQPAPAGAEDRAAGAADPVALSRGRDPAVLRPGRLYGGGGDEHGPGVPDGEKHGETSRTGVFWPTASTGASSRPRTSRTCCA